MLVSRNERSQPLVAAAQLQAFGPAQEGQAPEAPRQVRDLGHHMFGNRIPREGAQGLDDLGRRLTRGACVPDRKGSDAVRVHVLGRFHKLGEAHKSVARLGVAGACHLEENGPVSLNDEGLVVCGWQCCCIGHDKKSDKDNGACRQGQGRTRLRVARANPISYYWPCAKRADGGVNHGKAEYSRCPWLPIRFSCSWFDRAEVRPGSGSSPRGGAFRSALLRRGVQPSSKSCQVLPNARGRGLGERPLSPRMVGGE